MNMDLITVLVDGVSHTLTRCDQYANLYEFDRPDGSRATVVFYADELGDLDAMATVVGWRLQEHEDDMWRWISETFTCDRCRGRMHGDGRRTVDGRLTLCGRCNYVRLDRKWAGYPNGVYCAGGNPPASFRHNSSKLIAADTPVAS